MNRLRATEIQQYKEDGFVIPKFRLSDERVRQLRENLDDLVNRNPGVRPEKLVNAHVTGSNAEGVQGVQAFLDGYG